MALAEQVQRLLQDNRELRDHLRGRGGPPPGGPSGPEFEAVLQRLSRLESRAEDVERILRNVELGVATSNAKLEGVSSRFDDLGRRVDSGNSRVDELVRRFDSAVATALSRVPSWWQMPAVIGATVVLLGALWALAKYLRLVS